MICPTENNKKAQTKTTKTHQCNFLISFASFSSAPGKCLVLCNTTNNINNMSTLPSCVTHSPEAEDFWLTQQSVRRLQKQRKKKTARRKEHPRRGKTGLSSLAPDCCDIHSLCWAFKKISSKKISSQWPVLLRASQSDLKNNLQ